MTDTPCRCALIPCPGTILGHEGHCCLTDDTAACHQTEWVDAHLAICPRPHTEVRGEK